MSIRAADLLPAAGQSWGSYWLVITSLGGVLLLFYLAANGQLSAWLNLFVFSQPVAVQPTGGGTATTSPVAGGASGASPHSGASTAGPAASPPAAHSGSFGQALSAGFQSLGIFLKTGRTN